MAGKRIGIMGGTLDPVHNGHLAITKACMREAELDGAVLLPAGDPPHKKGETGGRHRLRMAELAAAELEGCRALDLEIRRPGVTYTVDTLTELREAYPDTEWYYIVGADTLNVLDTWREFPRVAGMCSFLVTGRPGIADGRMEERCRELAEKYGARVILTKAVGPDISSTAIRENVAEGRPISGMVPASVEEYIRREGLYLCRYAPEQILERLRGELSEHRFQHTLGVSSMCRRLAEKYGVPPERAYLAGLLHDCAKGMAPMAMRTMIAESGLETDAQETEQDQLLHAPAGAILAEREYGVRDREILSAIRCHTLGDEGMTPLELLVYVCDFCEPNRRPFRGLEEVRKLAETDLVQAAIACAEKTGEYVRVKGGRPHPRTLRMLKDLRERGR